ncbi:hypothetical protein KJ969_05475, partial [Patescibacteria group bacterium]|nr:hypothetical protein [Patescibacteria group bacterium]
MPELSTPTSPTIPTIPTPPEPETASALEAKFTPRQLLSPQLKLVFGIALGLILLLTLIGLIYRSSRRPTPTPSPIPITTPTPAQASATTKDLRLGLLSFPYPDNWLVLFSPLVDAKTPNLTPVYFVRSEGEYRENALCASAGSCTETPLILTFSTPTEIWTGYSLPDFIRATMPDFPLDKMEQNTYAERAGLGGYTDLSSLTYQAVIRIGDSTF